MSSNIIALKMLEVEPPELLSEALTDDLFAAIKMQRIPVLIKRIVGNRTHGFCEPTEYTESDEIVISSELFDVRSERLRSRQIEEILNVYLHECAHRLCGYGQGHNAAFLAINMLLHLRAGNRQIWHVNIYDIHEERHFKHAWRWSYELACELADTEFSAEHCAEIVLDKYSKWSEWMDSADDRKAQSEAKKQAKAAKADRELKLLSDAITGLKNDRWNFAFVGLLFGCLLTHFFGK